MQIHAVVGGIVHNARAVFKVLRGKQHWREVVGRHSIYIIIFDQYIHLTQKTIIRSRYSSHCCVRGDCWCHRKLGFNFAERLVVIFSIYRGFVLLNSEYIRVVSITIDLPEALHEFSAQPRRLLVLHRLSLSMMLLGHRLGEGHRRP